MSRWLVAGIFALLAAGSAAGSAAALADALTEPSARTWSVAGFVALRTAVLVALTIFVLGRRSPREHSRDPVAFGACAVAVSVVVLIEGPAASASTALVIVGDLVALGAWVWLLV